MGCTLSHNVLVLKTEITRAAEAKATSDDSSDLETILRQAFQHHNLRHYILSSWVPINREASDYYKSEAKSIAINFLDFWLDCQDYCAIPKSAFQSYRACYIFEKYLMHGASRLAPITTNVTDEIAEVLFGTSAIPQEIDSHLFEAANSEALEFLSCEVMPQYEKGAFADARRHANEVLLAIKNVSKRRGSLFNSPDRAALVTVMHKILSDKVYFSNFREFLKEYHCENLLVAYSDLMETEEKILSMPDSVDDEIKACNILHCLNTYYDKYLAIGAASRVPITEATYGDCLRKLANMTGVDVSYVISDMVIIIL